MEIDKTIERGAEPGGGSTPIHPAPITSGFVMPISAASGAIAFLFSGQGSQWSGMGSALYAVSPVFAAALDEACAHLDPLLSLPLRPVIFDEENAGLLDRTDFTQPALFAFEVAMYRTVESLGVRPDFVAGHSVGEIAAAHVAGVLSLADAAALVVARGRLMQSIGTTGAMVAIEAGEQEVLATLADCADRVGIGAVNASLSTVISGDEDAVLRLAEQWRDRGTRVHRLRVSHAFHSPHMDQVVRALAGVAAALRFRPPAIPVVSTLTGKALSAAEATSPEYWAEHARGCVRFADAASWLRAQGVTTFLEVGPNAVLTAFGQANAPDAEWIPVLRRGSDETEMLTAAMARLHVRGCGSTGHGCCPTPARSPFPPNSWRTKGG